MAKLKTIEDNRDLPFVLRFGIKPTITQRKEFDENGVPTQAYQYKVVQTIPHWTQPRTPGKQAGSDKK